LIPALFHGPVLTFWQTAGLFLLSKILLSGFAPHHPRRGRSEWMRKYHDKYGPGKFAERRGWGHGDIHDWKHDEKTPTPEQA
jgi:hypothetical protein